MFGCDVCLAKALNVWPGIRSDPTRPYDLLPRLVLSLSFSFLILLSFTLPLCSSISRHRYLLVCFHCSICCFIYHLGLCPCLKWYLSLSVFASFLSICTYTCFPYLLINASLRMILCASFFPYYFIFCISQYLPQKCHSILHFSVPLKMLFYCTNFCDFAATFFSLSLRIATSIFYLFARVFFVTRPQQRLRALVLTA